MLWIIGGNQEGIMQFDTTLFLTIAGARRAALGACAAGLLAFSAGAAQADQCSFFDAGTNESADGACKVEYDGNSETITVAGRKHVFVQSERQGQWALGTLDGKPAMRYEINRTQYSYATRDLKRFLDLSAD